MVPADVVNAGLLDELPNLRLLEMFDLVVVGRCQIGAHAPIVPGDDDAASSGWMLVVDSILDSQLGLTHRVPEDIGIPVAANTSDIDHRFLREEVLPDALNNQTHNGDPTPIFPIQR